YVTASSRGYLILYSPLLRPAYPPLFPYTTLFRSRSSRRRCRRASATPCRGCSRASPESEAGPGDCRRPRGRPSAGARARQPGLRALGRGPVAPAIPRAAHRRWIARLPEAAVVAPQRAVEVAALDVEIVAQDRAAVAQVGAHVEEARVVAVADQARPERHDLHQAAGTGRRDRVLPEVALDLDQAEHERGIETGALGLVAH